MFLLFIYFILTISAASKGHYSLRVSFSLSDCKEAFVQFPVLLESEKPRSSDVLLCLLQVEQELYSSTLFFYEVWYVAYRNKVRIKRIYMRRET